MATTEAATFAERVGVVARRDLSVELSYHYSFAMRYLGILLSIATFFFLSKLVGEAPLLGEYSGGYFEFALVGLIMTGLTATSLTAFNSAVSAEMSAGTLEILLATATRPFSMVAGVLVVPLALRLVDTVLYLGFGVWLLGAGFTAGGLLLSVPLFVMSIMTFAALGILAASFVVLTKRGDPITGLLVQITSLLAGTLFPISVLPTPLQYLSKLIPTFYALRGIRGVLLGGEGFLDILDELAVLAGFTAVLLPIALWSLSRAIRISKVTGTLGN
ncbi:MAG: ABC transporter permease [Acidimicrobiia bacterium]